MKMLYPLILISTTLLPGCATQSGMLSAYTGLPATCEANAAEMLALAEVDAFAANVNFVSGQIPTAAASAAAAGLIPAGWTWAPTIATAISYYRQGTHGARIEYLAHQRLHMRCPTLTVQAKAAPHTPEFGG